MSFLSDVMIWMRNVLLPPGSGAGRLDSQLLELSWEVSYLCWKKYFTKGILWVYSLSQLPAMVSAWCLHLKMRSLSFVFWLSVSKLCPLLKTLSFWNFKQNKCYLCSIIFITISNYGKRIVNGLQILGIFTAFFTFAQPLLISTELCFSSVLFIFLRLAIKMFTFININFNFYS